MPCKPKTRLNPYQHPPKQFLEKHIAHKHKWRYDTVDETDLTLRTNKSKNVIADYQYRSGDYELRRFLYWLILGVLILTPILILVKN